MKDRIQKDLFNTAAKHGLRPARELGGGHIHMGLDSSFDGNAKAFRNFVADFCNHPELVDGVFREGNRNAPSLVTEAQKQAFRGVLDDFDQGRLTSIEDFARAVQDRVYMLPNGSSKGPSIKYQALNLTRIPSKKIPAAEKTIEIRGIRPQRNMNDFLSELEIFYSRLEYTSKQKPIPFHGFDHALSSQEKAVLFKKYVSEAGLNPENYTALVTDQLRNMYSMVPNPKVRAGDCLPATLSSLLVGRH